MFPKREIIAVGDVFFARERAHQFGKNGGVEWKMGGCAPHDVDVVRELINASTHAEDKHYLRRCRAGNCAGKNVQ